MCENFQWIQSRNMNFILFISAGKALRVHTFAIKGCLMEYWKPVHSMARSKGWIHWILYRMQSTWFQSISLLKGRLIGFLYARSQSWTSPKRIYSAWIHLCWLELRLGTDTLGDKPYVLTFPFSSINKHLSRIQAETNRDSRRMHFPSLQLTKR